MVTKKTPAAKPKPQPHKPANNVAGRLVNAAARPPQFDETIDEQLVDHSGVFRVTSQISQAQTGHGDDSPRFPNESLAMPGFHDVEPTIVEPTEEVVIETEAARAAKRQRLATLAARANRAQPRKR